MFRKIQMSNVKKQGFTLLEALVAVFIFALMMTAVSGIFAKIIQTHRDARNVQENLESAQYAMNLMAKTLRTSSIDDTVGSPAPAPNGILLYDYSQSKCIMYTFNGTEVRSQKSSIAAFSDITDCYAANGATYSPSNVIAKNVDGKFDYTASSASTTMGKVTVSMTISQGDDAARIQSSVSLRDYNQALP